MKELETITDLVHHTQITDYTTDGIMSQLLSVDLSDYYLIRKVDETGLSKECVHISNLSHDERFLIHTKIIESVFKELITFDQYDMYHSEKFINRLLYHNNYFITLKHRLEKENFFDLLSGDIMSSKMYESYRSWYGKLMTYIINYCNNNKALDIQTCNFEMSVLTLMNICNRGTKVNYNSKRLLEITLYGNDVCINIHEIKMNIRSFN